MATEREKPKPVDSDSAKELLEELLDSEQFGQRGEAWFALQMILSVLVVFPPGGVRQIVDVLGYCALLFGLGLISVAGFDLGQSLTPVPKPRDNNVLTTSGAYELCRHPMYVVSVLLLQMSARCFPP
jgi:protein-S-isoprenylcysteine O-methyltransferase Ste14